MHSIGAIMSSASKRSVPVSAGLTYYQLEISKITKRSDIGELEKIEETMRNDIFHSTLDWQSAEEFEYGARDAVEVLIALDEIARECET